jgi:hypothetical protein
MRKSSAAVRIQSPEPLGDVAAHLKSILQQSADGHCLVGYIVMELAETWHTRKDEAGGLEIEEWLQKYVDQLKPLKWYIRRGKAYIAAKKAGLLGLVSSDGLAWLNEAVPESQHRVVAEVIRPQLKQHGTGVLSRDQIAKICHPYVTKRKSRFWASEELKDLRARVTRLEAQIRALGAEPVK